MAITSILTNHKEVGKIGALILDATLSHSHTYTNSVTQFPVENGFNISDHVRHEPDKLTMEGMITDTPLTTAISQQEVDSNILNYDATYAKYVHDKLLKEDNYGRTFAAFKTLCDLAGVSYPDQNTIKDPQILTVVTGLRAYTDMVITSLSFPVNPRTGLALRFTIDFIKINRVTLETVVMPNVKDINGHAPGVKSQSSKTAEKGKVDTPEVPVRADSIAKSLFNPTKKII